MEWYNVLSDSYIKNFLAFVIIPMSRDIFPAMLSICRFPFILLSK